jgi:glutathione S-transferase
MHEMLNQPTVHLFAVCAAILVLKVVITGNLTGFLRVRKGVYISPEDYTFAGLEPAPRNETIERLRRAHQNDLENVLPFLAVGFLYALTGPSYDLAWWLFVPFTAARVAHTIVYAAGRQPWRTLAFEVGNVTLIATTVLLLVNLLYAS